MKIFAILPAYNAEKTLVQTLKAIPAGSVDEIILVDDCSQDNTFSLAQKIALTQGEYPFIKMHAFQHGENKGYGGNQKTCYNKALELGADIVVMLHPDYQYDPTVIPCMTELIKTGHADVVLGSRIRTRKETLDGGMPVYKYVANRTLTAIENIASGLNLSEWHTGMRMYTRKVLETVPFKTLSDDFVFDTQFLFEVVKHKFSIGEVAVPVRYFKEASSINLKRSITYGLETLGVVCKFLWWKVRG